MIDNRTQFTLRLDKEINLKIKKIAEAESRSTSKMIEYILKKEIDQYEREHGPIDISDDLTERS